MIPDLERFRERGMIWSKEGGFSAEVVPPSDIDLQRETMIFMLHHLELIDALLGVAFADLLEGFVLVPALHHVLNVDFVRVRHLAQWVETQCRRRVHFIKNPLSNELGSE